MLRSLVGSEMCIRDRLSLLNHPSSPNTTMTSTVVWRGFRAKVGAVPPKVTVYAELSTAPLVVLQGQMDDANTKDRIFETCLICIAILAAELSVVLDRADRISAMTVSTAGMSLLAASDGDGPLAKEMVDTRRELSLLVVPVSYTHLRAHETPEHLVCRLLLEKKKK
eukprot:TRINITY_DN14504_c0_g1_i1.p1 TRINITY_DN14504_c0_g1~~TRINITY_DN14504_c0_g1_i1.p1  ORF type:complete len:167 (-),score=31.33 TRINITY_DN14504_c0_g1_i1:40-540(-)